MDNTYLSKTTLLSATSSSYLPKTTSLSATSSSYLPKTTSLSATYLPKTTTTSSTYAISPKSKTLLPRTNFSLFTLLKLSKIKNIESIKYPKYVKEIKYIKDKHLKVFQTYWYSGESWEIKIKIKNSKMQIVLDHQVIELIIDSENKVSLHNLTDPNIMNWITYSGKSISDSIFLQNQGSPISDKLMYPDEIDKLLTDNSIFSMFINSDGLILVILMYNF